VHETHSYSAALCAHFLSQFALNSDNKCRKYGWKLFTPLSKVCLSCADFHGNHKYSKKFDGHLRYRILSHLKKNAENLGNIAFTSLSKTLLSLHRFVFETHIHSAALRGDNLHQIFTHIGQELWQLRYKFTCALE
jgi:hypothetical protein